MFAAADNASRRVTIPGDVLPSKALAPGPDAPARGADRVAEHLMRRAVRRLGLFAVLTLAGQFTVWLAVNLIQTARAAMDCLRRGRVVGHESAGPARPVQ